MKFELCFRGFALEGPVSICIVNRSFQVHLPERVYKSVSAMAVFMSSLDFGFVSGLEYLW